MFACCVAASRPNALWESRADLRMIQCGLVGTSLDVVMLACPAFCQLQFVESGVDVFHRLYSVCLLFAPHSFSSHHCPRNIRVLDLLRWKLNKSSDSMTRSAYFPGVIDPRFCSTKFANAPLIVYARSAVSRSIVCAGTQPPSGLPSSPLRVSAV